MRKVIYFLGICSMLSLTGCIAFNTTPYSNVDAVNTVVDLSQKNYEILGVVEGFSEQVYVLGIGGYSKKSLFENAKADMYKNADLKDGEALIYPSTTTSVVNYVVVTKVRAKASAYKIRLHKANTTSATPKVASNENLEKKATVETVTPVPTPTTQEDKTNKTFKLANGTAFNMVYVESNENNPSFYIGETEVTENMWSSVMQDASTNNAKRAIVNITIDEAMNFCKKINTRFAKGLPKGYVFSLPTEYQWEFAAKGGDVASKFIYSGSNKIDKVAWYAFNTEKGYYNVATKSPNKLGIYDMSGGVWEMCLASDGSYVSRGGSYLDTKSLCQISSRSVLGDKQKSKKIGFRLVLTKQ